MNLKAVIFDLDGILVDTSIFHGQAWKKVVEDKGISRMASLKIALGENARLYSDADLQTLAEKKNQHYLALTQTISPADLYDGVRELFDDLRSAGIKIVLGSASKNAAPILDSLGIASYFDAVADGFAYTHGKPHADVFLTGARMVGVSPTECVVVEDAAAGITAALDGGFVAVGMGSYASLKHAHLFVKTLRELSAAKLTALHSRFRCDRWTVVREGIHPSREASLQTIFSIGNGLLGIRGHLSALPLGKPWGAYMAGVFDHIRRPDPNPEGWGSFMQYWGDASLARGEQIEACIMPLPNFLDVRFTLDGQRVDFTQGTVKSFTRRLDLRSGMFTAEALWLSPAGQELRLVERRLADWTDARRVFVQYELEAMNFSGPVEIAAGINTNVIFNMDNVPQTLFDVTARYGAGQSCMVEVRGKSDGMTVAFGSHLTVHDRPETDYNVLVEPDGLYVHAQADLRQGQLLYVERAVVTTSGRCCADSLACVRSCLPEAAKLSLGQARIDSTAVTHELWTNSDVVIDGPADDQLAMRFSVYNMLMAASRDDDGVSLGAKGLTGEMYRGMVFWDTDLFMMPVFSFTQPAMARNLAMFRVKGLPGARAKAKRMGLRGACFPWETASGDENTEKWLRLLTHQLHVSADVAYALQQYVDATGDTDFYIRHGAELLLDTALFWLSKLERGENGKWFIPQAGGPDEFHVVCDASAYIHHMAAWNLRAAAKAAAFLREHSPEQLSAVLSRIGMTREEAASLEATAAEIDPLVRDDGVLEQCRGFFALREEPADPKKFISDVQCTQVVKQADVVMLMYLLADRFDDRTVRANFEFYEPRTQHASSLSHGVHGLVAARLGLHDKADNYMRRSMGMDLHDEMDNASWGLHMAASGMNYVAVTQGYGGTRFTDGKLHVNPHLPAHWQGLQFRTFAGGALVEVRASGDGTTRVTNLPASRATLTVVLGGKEFTLQPGQTRSA
jgi:beta-phosphoglucomutase